MNYSWNGRPIEDIDAWCRDRGEQMVRVRKTWREPVTLASIRAGDDGTRQELMSMPAAFFSGMRFGGSRDEQFSEIGRYDP